MPRIDAPWSIKIHVKPNIEEQLKSMIEKAF